MRSRAFAEHNFFKEVKRFHPECVGLMASVRYMLSSGRDGDEQVVQLLERLCDLVESHLLAAQDEGYLEEVIDRSPSLEEAKARLRRQHASLVDELHDVRSLLGRLGRLDRATWRRELAERFEQFARRLLMHEAEEEDLVQEATGESEVSLARRGFVRTG